MWIITGGAGFIGSALLWKLNQKGLNDLLVVDFLDAAKKKNLQGKTYKEYVEADVFLDRIKSGTQAKVEGIVHLGACSSTTETNEEYLRKNNFEYTRTLAEWALANQARYIYASSAATYGDGAFGYSTDDATTRKLVPLNLYGHSKQNFDLWALNQGVLKKMIVIKFFNIFGPNEYHKGDMRSVVAKSYEQIKKDGKIYLFKSYRADYKDGEQVRDFLYVKDANDIVYEFMTGNGYGGLYNLGAGKARSWNDLAKAIFVALGKPVNIEYIEMPETLRSKYQYHTEADMSWLKGKTLPPFRSLEDSVKDYVQNYLSKEDPYL